MSGYPDVVDVDGIGKKSPLQYAGDAKRGFRENPMYGFWVYDISSSGPNAFRDEIFLYPNPQSIQMSEPTATTIQALQGGGKYIERRGNLFKDIVVSGTTGYMPYRRAVAQSRQFESRFRFDDDDDVAASLYPVSGYAKFHELRNFFRKYQNTLRTESRSAVQDLRMVWVNYKDDEFFIVEPLDFKTTRDKSKPLSYDYSIPLKFLSVLDKELVKSNDVLQPTSSKFGKFVAGLAAARKWLAKVARLINIVKSLINSFVAAVRSVVETALHLMDTVFTAVDSFVNAALDAVNLPQSIMRDTARAWARTLEVAYEIGFTLPTEGVASMLELHQSCLQFAAETEMFASSMSDGYTQLYNRFAAPEGNMRGTDSGIADSVATGSTQTATTGHILLFGETIQAFAARTLGDASRFLEIVVLNNLRPPYTSPSEHERGHNTVCPGDTVLCPGQPPSAGEKQQAVQPSDNGSKPPETYTGQAVDGTVDLIVADVTALLELWLVDRWKGFVAEFISGTGKGQTALISSNTGSVLNFQAPVAIAADTSTIYIIRPVGAVSVVNVALAALGVDIALTQIKDIAKVATGDVQKIRGFPNMQQAVDNKFETEQGSLIAHNFYGIRGAPGSRADPNGLTRVYVNARRTLLSDPRISAIRRLSYSAEKDVVKLTGELELSMGGVTQTISGALANGR